MNVGGDLNESGSSRFKYLDTWSPVVRAIWMDFRRSGLVEGGVSWQGK